jgi:hypothetical protein
MQNPFKDLQTVSTAILKDMAFKACRIKTAPDDLSDVNGWYCVGGSSCSANAVVLSNERGIQIAKSRKLHPLNENTS